MTRGQAPHPVISGSDEFGLNGALHSGLNNTPGGYQPYVPTPLGAAAQGVANQLNTPAGTGRRLSTGTSNAPNSADIARAAERLAAVNLPSERPTNCMGSVGFSEQTLSPVHPHFGGASATYVNSAPGYSSYSQFHAAELCWLH